MSLAPDRHEDLLDQLLPHQRAVIDQYRGDVRHVHLIAPPGTGKTVTAVALAIDEARRNPNARILLIAPMRALVVQYAHRLSAEGLPTDVIDRYSYRALVDRNQPTEVWSGQTAYAITLAFARQSDIASTLISNKWDLVIADDVPTGDSIAGLLLKQLLASTKASLSISSFDNVGLDAPNNVVRIKWDLEVIVDHAGGSLAPPPLEFTTINFAADRELESIALELRAEAGLPEPGMRDAILEAAASSPAALERVIESALTRLQTESEDQGTDDGGTQSPELEPQLRNAFVSASLRLQGLNEDQKAIALIACIRSVLGSNPNARVCIVTKYRSTAYYVSAVLEAEGFECLIAAGTAHHTVRSENIGRFLLHQTPAILIATRALLTFESRLRRVTHLIFYEPVRQSLQVDKIIGQTNGIGRSEQLRVYEMVGE